MLLLSRARRWWICWLLSILQALPLQLLQSSIKTSSSLIITAGLTSIASSELGQAAQDTSDKDKTDAQTLREDFDNQQDGKQNLSHFCLIDQYVHYKDQVFALADPRQYKSHPILNFNKSASRIETLVEQNKLIFRAFEKTQNGKILNDEPIDSSGRLIAQHEVLFADELLSVTPIERDPDLVLVLSSAGEIFALDKGLLLPALFENIIPVFSIWKIPTTNQAQQTWNNKFLTTKAHGKFITDFLNMGTAPDWITDTQLSRALVAPSDSHQYITSGSFYFGREEVGYTEDNSIKNNIVLGGILDRRSILSSVAYGIAHLLTLSTTLMPKNLRWRQVQTNFEQISQKYNQYIEQISEQPVSLIDQLVLSRFEKKELIHIHSSLVEVQNKADGHARLGKINHAGLIHFRQRLEKSIQDNQDKNYPTKQINFEKEWQRLVQTNMQEPILDILQFIPSTKISSDENLTPQESEKTSSQLQHLISKLDHQVQSMGSRMRQWPLKPIGFALFAVTYLGFPYLYENFEAASSFLFAHLIYDNLYPPVLKDLAARGPAIAGLIVSSSIYPLLIFFSFSIGELIEFLARSSSRLASHPQFYNTHRRFKSWARDFGRPEELKFSWDLQSEKLRLLGIFMREMSILNYPPLRLLGEIFAWIAKKPLRQKNLVESLQLGVSPWTQVDIDINQDRKEKAFAGFNSPFTSTEELQQQAQIKWKWMQTHAIQRDERRLLASKLALMLVSEEQKITPDLLLSQLESLPIKAWTHVLQDQTRRKHALVLNETLIQELQQVSAKDIELALTRDREIFLKIYRQTFETAIMLKKSKLEYFYQESKYQWDILQSKLKCYLIQFINLGLENTRLWKAIRPIEINRVTMKQAISELGADTIITAISGALGPPPLFKFADPAHPENLFGSNHFPFLSPVGLAVININAFFHSHSAAVLAVVFGARENIQDEPYAPLSDQTHLFKPKVEKLHETLGQSFKTLFNFIESDFGGYQLRNFVSLWKNWSFLTCVSLVFRMGVLGWGFPESLGGFIVEESLNFILYRWLWVFIRSSNIHREIRYKRNEYIIKSLIQTLSENHHDPTSVKRAVQSAFELYRQYDQPALGKLIQNVSKLVVHPEMRFRPLQQYELRSTTQKIRDPSGNLNDQLQERFGLIAQLLAETKQLTLMVQSNDSSDQQIEVQSQNVERARHLLIEHVHSQKKNTTHDDPNNQQAIDQAVAHGFLQLLRSHPPLPTQVATSYQNLTTFWLGAVGTNVISMLSFGVSVDQESMKDPWTVLGYAAASIAFIGASWALTSEKAWRYYLQKRPELQKLKIFSSATSSIEDISVPKTSSSSSCSQFLL